MSGWRVTFVDGSGEDAPEGADRYRVVDGLLLSFLASRTYGPDELLATYVLVNVRKWEPLR